MNIIENLSQFLSMLQFLFVMILEIYLPCYFANQITWNSSLLCTQIYSSEWLKFSAVTRKLIYLYMEFIKHPEKVKAGNYFDVGLPIFTKVRCLIFNLFWWNWFKYLCLISFHIFYHCRLWIMPIHFLLL